MRIHTDAPEVKQIAAMAFPSYHGKTFSVEPLTGPMRLDSYLSGGSRDYYVMIDLASGRNIAIPENGTPFSNGGQVFNLENGLPDGVALVQHTIFSGKDLGITVYVSPNNLNRMALPQPAELSLAEKIVLAYTRSRKSSYNGLNRQQMALDESGFPEAEWNTAKASCISKGYLNAAGAITNNGRNAIGNTSPESLQWPGFKRFAWQ